MAAEVVPSVCPLCRSREVKTIVYGFPTSDVFDDPRYEIGGCPISDDNPRFACADCGYRWGSR